MTSGFVSYPQRPLTPTELLRVGAALLPFGLPFGKGFPNTDIWIAMESALPHRVIGVAASRDEATKMIDARQHGAPHAEVYGPYAPPVSSIAQLDQTDVCAHDDTTLTRSRTNLGDLRRFERRHADTKSMRLIIEWHAHGDLPTTAEIELEPHSDAIFLTRSSREAFAYPRYLSIFGPEYLAALRKTLGEA